MKDSVIIEEMKKYLKNAIVVSDSRVEREIYLNILLKIIDMKTASQEA